MNTKVSTAIDTTKKGGLIIKAVITWIINHRQALIWAFLLGLVALAYFGGK